MSNRFGSGEFEQKFLVPELVSQIQEHSGENVFVEMADGLQAVTAAVLATGRKGSVTMTITVGAVFISAKGAKEKKWAAGEVAARAVVTVNEPKRAGPPVKLARFWVTEEGWLSPIEPSFLDPDTGEIVDPRGRS